MPSNPSDVADRIDRLTRTALLAVEDIGRAKTRLELMAKGDCPPNPGQFGYAAQYLNEAAGMLLTVTRGLADIVNELRSPEAGETTAPAAGATPEAFLTRVLDDLNGVVQDWDPCDTNNTDALARIARLAGFVEAYAAGKGH